MITISNSLLLLVDVQGKLADLMHDRDTLFANLQKLIRGMQALQIPLVWAEQIPDKMGTTIPQVRDLLPGDKPFPKSSFSCCGCADLMARLGSLKRKQVILAGIETHVCIYQTARDLLLGGYEVELVADAVSSRTLSNKQIGIERIRSAGARITSVECVLFELMGTAGHPAFRDILKIVK
mgnify:CR=1 FL=1